MLKIAIFVGFNRGSELSDPEKKLNGEGNLYRSVKVESFGGFPKTYIKRLLKEAYGNALIQMKENKNQLEGSNFCKKYFSKKEKTP